jgi:IS30 family transposase
MTKYNHLTYEQRYQIYSLNKISYTQKMIANIIKVS